MTIRRDYWYVVAQGGASVMSESGDYVITTSYWTDVQEPLEIRMVRGQYLPCVSCRYFSTCDVPRSRHLRNVKQPVIRNITWCDRYDIIR